MTTNSPWGPNDIFLVVGGYNLIGDGDRVNSIKLPDATATIEDTTGVGAMQPRHKFTGHKSYDDIEFDGWFSDESDSINTRLQAISQTARVLMGGDAGQAIGDPFVGGTALDFQYKRRPEPTLLVKAGGALRTTGDVHHGVLLKPLTAITADGDTEASSIDLGASTVAIATSSVANPSVITTSAPHGLETGDTVTIAGHSGSTPDINGDRVVTVLTPTTFTIPLNVTVGGTGGTMRRIKTAGGVWLYAEVPALALGGYDDLTFDFSHSVDNAAWVSLDTLAFTSAPDGQRVFVSGTINRYLSVAWSFTGTGSSPSATILAGASRQ